MKQSIVWILVFGVWSLTGRAMAQEPIMYLHFEHRVGKDTLELMNKTYINAHNEPFTVNKFKYYISNIVLRDSMNKAEAYPGTYLVDEADKWSKFFAIGELPHFNPRFIEFTIGVDSIYNVGGVHTGSLDPIKGMFWTWNNGYVFAKLEGQSDSSHAAANYFMYDVGGYKQRHNATRKVKLEISHTLIHSGTLTIKADLLKWFQAVTNISIGQSSLCHEPGKFAMQLADNYATMFSVTEMK